MARDDSFFAIALIAVGVFLVFGMVGMTASGRMKTSPQGRRDIIRHEGIRYEPYKDSAGYWTIGIGHLVVPGDGVPRTTNGVPLPISEELMMTLFETDLSHAEIAILTNARVPLTQGQFDALTDWAFQFGAGKVRTSTLISKLNTGDYPGAAEEFKRWVYAGGVVNPGIVARREDNYTTFLT